MFLRVRVSPPDADRDSVHVKLPSYEMVGDIALDGTVTVRVPDRDIPSAKRAVVQAAALERGATVHNLFPTLSDQMAWRDHLERIYGAGKIRGLPEVL